MFERLKKMEQRWQREKQRTWEKKVKTSQEYLRAKTEPRWKVFLLCGLCLFITGMMPLSVSIFRVAALEDPHVVEVDYYGIETIATGIHSFAVRMYTGLNAQTYDVDWWVLRELYEKPGRFADMLAEELDTGEPLTLQVVERGTVLGVTSRKNGKQYLGFEECYPIYIRNVYNELYGSLGFLAIAGSLVLIGLCLKRKKGRRHKRKRKAVRE